jgi:hypothetical protein
LSFRVILPLTLAFIPAYALVNTLRTGEGFSFWLRVFIAAAGVKTHDAVMCRVGRVIGQYSTCFIDENAKLWQGRGVWREKRNLCSTASNMSLSTTGKYLRF